jgi:hypothetical protein
MKNLFKFGFLALAISLSVAACSSNKTEEVAADTTLAVDTAAVDTAAADTTVAVDTTAATK